MMRAYRDLSIAPSTRKKYIDHCGKWVAFRGAAPLLVPAETSLHDRARVLTEFLTHLQREGLVHGNSVKGYLSAVAWLHTVNDLPHPFGMAGRGSRTAATAIVTGFNRATAQPSTLKRRPVSADEMFAMAQIGSAAMQACDMRLWRAVAVGIFSFVFMARASTAAGQLLDDVTVTGSAIVVFLSVEKGRPPGERKRRMVWQRFGSPLRGSAHPFDVLATFIVRRHTQMADGDHRLFQLPGEPEPVPEASCGEWMTQAFDAMGIKRLASDLHPHSYRSGGATTAISMGTSPVLIQRWGGWRADKSMQVYIHPGERSVHERLFFGQMLAGSDGHRGLDD